MCLSVNVHKLADVEHHGAKILQRTALSQAGLDAGDQFTVCRFGGVDFVDKHIVLGQVQSQLIGADGAAPGADTDVAFALDW